MNNYYIKDLQVGMAETFKVVITNEMMDMFTHISNDVNPLHIDNEFARERNFSGKVVYGMLTASFYSTLVGVYLPGKYALLQGLDISFNAPVFCHDELIVTGTVVYINLAYKLIEVKAMIENQLGKKVSKAMIRVRVNE